MRKLFKNVREYAASYYLTQARRIKKWEKSLNRHTQQRLLTRYCFKVGFYYEMQGNHEKMLRYVEPRYTTADIVLRQHHHHHRHRCRPRATVIAIIQPLPPSFNHQNHHHYYSRRHNSCRHCNHYHLSPKPLFIHQLPPPAPPALPFRYYRMSYEYLTQLPRGGSDDYVPPSPSATKQSALQRAR